MERCECLPLNIYEHIFFIRSLHESVLVKTKPFNRQTVIVLCG